jgi:ribonuclease HI
MVSTHQEEMRAAISAIQSAEAAYEEAILHGLSKYVEDFMMAINQ